MNGMSLKSRRGIAVVGALLLVSAAGMVGCRRNNAGNATPPPPSLTWMQNATAYRTMAVGTPITVNCPPGAATGGVWGTDVYSSDSSICTAAAHAGRVNPAMGGLVTFYMRGPGINFVATTRNGVASRSWAAWPSSFSFDPNAVQPPTPTVSAPPVAPVMVPTPSAFPMPSVPVDATTPLMPGHALFIQWASSWYAGRVVAPQPDGTVRVHYDGWSAGFDANVERTRLRIPGVGMLQMAGAEPATAGTSLSTTTPVTHPALSGAAPVMPAPPSMPVMPVPPMGGAVLPATWSQSATQYRGQNGTTLRFMCPPGGTASSVYGTGTYSDDSSICTAAVHAGRIQLATGGVVTIQIMPGMPAYQGTAANGITSSNWSNYPGSFVVR